MGHSKEIVARLRHALRDADKLPGHGREVAAMVDKFRKEHDLEEEDVLGVQKKARNA